jgi:hypothetical protein
MLQYRVLIYGDVFSRGCDKVGEQPGVKIVVLRAVGYGAVAAVI